MFGRRNVKTSRHVAARSEIGPWRRAAPRVGCSGDALCIEKVLDAHNAPRRAPRAAARRHVVTVSLRRAAPAAESDAEFCRSCGGDVHAALPCRPRRSRCIPIHHSRRIRRAWTTTICAAASRRTTRCLARPPPRWRATRCRLSPLNGALPRRLRRSALRCGQILTHAAGHAGIWWRQQLDS